jgi:outer membrane protein assembly factor BamB
MFRINPAHTGVSAARLFEGQGGVKWRVKTGDAVRSTPAVTLSRLYVGSGDGYLYALERSTGKTVWRFQAGSPVHSSPAVASGLVIAATLGGRIFAVDQAAGRIRWSMQTGDTLPRNIAPAGGWDLLVSSPVVTGNTVVIGGQDGIVYSLDLTTGRVKWRGKTNGKVRGTPAVSEGMVVAGSWDGRVYAFDLSTGQERWVNRTAGDTMNLKGFGYDRRAIQGSPAIAGGRVFIGSRDGGFYGIDFRTGERQWRATHRGSWVVGSATAEPGRVTVGSSDGHFVHAVDPATGKDIWRLETGMNVLASPLRVADLTIIGLYHTEGAGGGVWALDAATGAVRWKLDLDAAVMSSPVAADGELYIGTEDGSVVAIEQVSPVVPRLAVFYDAALSRVARMRAPELALEYFRDLGYDVLASDSLARFMTARISDGVPSAIVFAMDVAPASVMPTISDTVLIRRYLDAGGKVVWIGQPIGIAAYDTAGKMTAYSPERTATVLGVSLASLEFDEFNGHPTPLGTKWGLGPALRGGTPIKATGSIRALTLDELGASSAWVREFRADRPGSGYVQLWGLGATVDRLPYVRAVAEYGLLRKP